MDSKMKFVARRNSSLVKTKPFLFGAFSGLVVFGLDDPTKATKLFLPSLQRDSRIERGFPTTQTTKPVSASTATLLRGGHGFSFSTSPIKDAAAVPSEVAQASPVSDVSPWQGSTTSFLGKKTSSNGHGFLQIELPQGEQLAMGLRQFVANLGTIVEGGIVVTKDGEVSSEGTGKPPVPELKGLQTVTDAERLKGPEKIATAEHYEKGRENAKKTDSVYIKLQGGDYTYTKHGDTHIENPPEDLFWKFEVVPEVTEVETTVSDTKKPDDHGPSKDAKQWVIDGRNWHKFLRVLNELVEGIKQVDARHREQERARVRAWLDALKTFSESHVPPYKFQGSSVSGLKIVLVDEKSASLEAKEVEQWVKAHNVVDVVNDRLTKAEGVPHTTQQAKPSNKVPRSVEASDPKNEKILERLPDTQESKVPIKDFLKFVIEESPSPDHIEKRILPGAWVGVVGLSDEEQKAIASTGSVVITVTVHSSSGPSITVTVCQPPSVMVFARLKKKLNDYLSGKVPPVPAKDFEIRPEVTGNLEVVQKQTKVDMTSKELQLSVHGSRIPIDWTVEKVTKAFNEHYGHLHTSVRSNVKAWGGFGGSYIMKTKTIIDEEKWAKLEQTKDNTPLSKARVSMLREADSNRPNGSPEAQLLNIPSYEKIVSIGYSTEDTFTHEFEAKNVELQNNQEMVLKDMIPFTSQTGFEVTEGDFKYNLRHLCLLLYPAGPSRNTVQAMFTDIGKNTQQAHNLVLEVLEGKAVAEIDAINEKVQQRFQEALGFLNSTSPGAASGDTSSPPINELKSVLLRKQMAKQAEFVDLKKKAETSDVESVP